MAKEFSEFAGEVLKTFTRDEDEFTVEVAEPSDRRELNNLAEGWGRPLSSFPTMWEGRNYWEDYPPIVLKHDDTIIGFRSATIDGGYITSYHVLIVDEYRHRGLSREFFGATIDLANDLGCGRMKTQTVEGPGYEFCCKIGLEPIGIQNNAYVFDYSIEGCRSYSELKEAAQEKDMRTTGPSIPDTVLNRYDVKLDETYVKLDDLRSSD